MTTQKRLSVVWILMIFLAIPLFGCTSNIKHIPKEAASAPKTESFNAPIDAVWSAAQRALAEDETFKVLDKSSGLMVTEFRAVDGKELSLWATNFLGKTYKNSYTLNFDPQGGKTAVTVNVKLQANQIILLSREENIPEVESYLREKLFDKIAQNLKGYVAATAQEQELPAVANGKAKGKSKKKRAN